ncbi:MAG: hypothetical protein RLN80_13165, partial [Rhodospirillales bacterium]
MSFFQSLLNLFLGNQDDAPAASQAAGGIQNAPGASVVALLSPFGDPAVDGPEGVMMRGLSMRSELAIRLSAKKIEMSGEGALAGRLAAAAEVALEQAVPMNADIVIWGTVAAESGDLNIRLFPVRQEPLTKPGAVGLGDLLRVPVNFGVEIGDLLYAAILAAVPPRNELHLREVLAELGPVLDRLSETFQAGPPGLTENQAFSVLAAYGNCLAALAGRTRNAEMMNIAAETLWKAIEMPAAANLPLDAGMAQSHRAACYMALADLQEEPSYLSTAAEAFASAADAFGAETQPDDWALAQMNRGHALFRHGANSNEPRSLQAAIKAYGEALKVFTRPRSPSRWSELMNSQGVTLAQLAESFSGTALAEQAVECFMKALEVRRRESVPGLWAASQNNLGAALFSLGKATGDNSLLQRAASAFRGAMEVYQEAGSTNNVHVLQKNIGRVERLLETRGVPVTPDGPEKGGKAATAE